MHGRHLTLAERELLAIRLALGDTRGEVAKELGCHESTIRRELKRNGVEWTYLPAQAQALADQRRRESKAPWKLERAELAEFVKEGLRQYWSPEEIAGRWRKEHPRRRGQWVSHQCLYDWIWRQKAQGQDWHRYLRRAYKKRRKRQESPERRGRIVGRVGIEQRPAIVERRARLGDWESDRMEGSGSTAGLASHVERKSRYTVLAELADGTAATFNAGTIHAFRRHGDLPRRTTTADNGKEFAAHAELAARLGLDVPAYLPAGRQVLRPAVPCVGTWDEREHQRAGASVLPQRTGPASGHAPAGGARGAPAEQPTQEVPGLPHAPGSAAAIMIAARRAFQN